MVLYTYSMSTLIRLALQIGVMICMLTWMVFADDLIAAESCTTNTNHGSLHHHHHQQQQQSLHELLALYGSDKALWHGYTRYYEPLLGVIRHEPIQMLEIGVEQGNSTEAWSRYFYNAKHIYGIDFGRKVDDDHNTRRDHNGQEWTDTHTDDSIDGVGMHLKPIPCDVSLAHTLHRKERGDADTNTDNTHNTRNTRNTHNTDKNVNTNIFTCSIYHGDQSNIKFLDAFIEQTDTSGALDIIIDDGSHMPEHQLISFERLWLEVAPGGYYFIEDIETSYWKSRVQLYENLTTGKFNLVHHFKQVADTINREFSYRNIHSKNKKDNDSSNSDSLSEDIYGTISTITFAQNLIILKKQTQWEKDTYFSRKYRFPEALP